MGLSSFIIVTLLKVGIYSISILNQKKLSNSLRKSVMNELSTNFTFLVAFIDIY